MSFFALTVSGKTDDGRFGQGKALKFLSKTVARIAQDSHWTPGLVEQVVVGLKEDASAPTGELGSQNFLDEFQQTG